MFDTLPETRSHGFVLGKGSVSGALLFHSLVLLALVGTSMLARVDPGDPPPFPGAFEFIRYESPRLGIDLTAGSRLVRKPEQKTPQTPRKAPEAPVWKQPDRIDDLRENLAEPEVPSSPTDSQADATGAAGTGGEGSGDGRGDGFGEGDGEEGVPGGDPNGMGIGTPAPAADDDILDVGGDVEAPVLIRRVEPEYPSIARRVGIHGVVVLEGVIGTDGKIESLTVASSIPVLNRAALDAVKQWVYRPARQHGLLVRVRVTIRVDFRLD